MLRFIRAAASAALVILFVNPALAQDRRVPSSGAELRLSYAPIVQRVQPAVVNVYAAKTVQNRNPLLADPHPAPERPALPPLLRRPRPAARADAALARIGRDGRCVRPRGYQQSRH